MAKAKKNNPGTPEVLQEPKVYKINFAISKTVKVTATGMQEAIDGLKEHKLGEYITHDNLSVLASD